MLILYTFFAKNAIAKTKFVTGKAIFMKTAAIISEYNPFHAGHKYQIDKLREEGYDLIMAIMSGSVTQRGELAVADKITRARAALSCGVDLVVELPTPYSCSSAEFFAYGGVFAADALGADVLSFGSECGDIDRLISHASTVKHARAGEGAARAELDGTSFMSNDMLGIEYVRAIERIGSRITPVTHKRIGGGYNDKNAETQYPSASAIRALMSEDGKSTALSLLPKEAAECLADSIALYDEKTRNDRLFAAISSRLLYTPKEDLEKCAFMSGGLVGRMRAAAEKATSLEGLYSLSATKVYTYGRIRRAAISALCNVDASAIRRPPEYLTLLAANGKGRRYLSGNKVSLEVCSAVRQKKKYTSFEYEKRFDLLYAMISTGENTERRIYYSFPPAMYQS